MINAIFVKCLDIYNIYCRPTCRHDYMISLTWHVYEYIQDAWISILKWRQDDYNFKFVNEGMFYATGLLTQYDWFSLSEWWCYCVAYSVPHTVQCVHCMCFLAVALAWHCVSVSSHTTQRVSSFVLPAGTCGGLRLLARPSSPLTPQPRWPCCRWTPAACHQSSLLRMKSNSGK